MAGELTLKVATRTGALALSLADRFLGLQFLQDLSEFFLAFEGMYDGFKERAARVHALLRDARVRASWWSRARRALALDEAVYFHRRLRESEMPFVGFVVNRVHPEPAAGARGRRAPRGWTRTWRARCTRSTATSSAWRAHDAPRARPAGGRHRRAAPARAGAGADVHDLRGLLEVGEAMLGPARVSARRQRRPRGTRGAMRIILYSGKGGVGKTSLSAATAVRAAALGHRTLVVSTDAAHSLADALDVDDRGRAHARREEPRRRSRSTSTTSWPTTGA